MQILVVDDSNLVRSKLRKELESGGYSVIEAQSGEEALKKAVENEVALITLDIEMPGLNGYQSCEKLRKLSMDSSTTSRDISNTPVIFVTANDTIDGRIKGFEVGATDFIVKSYQSGELCSLVDEILKPGDLYKECGVLVAHRSRTIRRRVTSTLMQFGVRIFETSNREETTEVLKQYGESIDLVVNISGLDQISASELCRLVHRDLGFKDVPIVILAHQYSDEERLTSFQAGVSDYIRTPFLKEEFMARMKTHLHAALHTRKMAKLNEELRRSNKALQDFSYTISHDLKSPLSTAYMYSELLLNNAEPDSENHKYLTRIGELTMRMGIMIGRLFDYATIEHSESELELVDLTTIAKEVVEDLSAVISEAQATVKIDNLPTVMANAVQMRQLVQNLVANAIRYRKPNAKPIVHIYSEPSKQNNPTSTACRICVEDNGIGFEEKYAEEIFELFKRIPESADKYEGSGIGLASCRKIVEAHGGNIVAEGQLGVGSKFIFTLPAQPERRSH